MIFVAGAMTFDPADIPQFRRDVAAMRPKVLAEQGCHHYSLLVEDEAAGLVNVIEQWDDDAALAVHFTQPWISEFAVKYLTRMKASTVQVYDIAGIRPLPGM